MKTKNRLWLIGVVSIVVACSGPSDQREGRLQICPEDLVDDVRQTLGLAEVNVISVDALVERSEEKGFSREFARYGSSPPNQCADLKDLEPSTEVLWIHAGLDESKLTSRSFVVLGNPSGFVTHIEGRYFFEPPPP